MLFPLTRRPVSVVFWFWASHHYFRLDRVPAVSSTSFWLTVIHSVSHSISGGRREGEGIHGVPEDTANEQRAHGFASQMTGPEENTRTRQLNAPKSSFLGYPNEIAPIRTL